MSKVRSSPARPAGGEFAYPSGRRGVRSKSEKARREKKEYSFETVEAAECLYIYRQKTYEEIGKITGVPVVTIQRWSDKYEWRKKKMDYIKAQVGFRRDLYLLRLKLLAGAIESTDPQMVHAMANLQRIIDSVEKGKSLEDLPAEPEKGLGLSPATLEKIKEEIYGIRKPGIQESEVRSQESGARRNE